MFGIENTHTHTHTHTNIIQFFLSTYVIMKKKV